MMKVCAGCQGGQEKKQKQDGSLSDPPDDICIRHEETITLTEPVSHFKKKNKGSLPLQKELQIFNLTLLKFRQMFLPT